MHNRHGGEVVRFSAIFPTVYCMKRMSLLLFITRLYRLSFSLTFDSRIAGTAVQDGFLTTNRFRITVNPCRSCLIGASAVLTIDF